ncbi:kinetochore-associated protein 1 [Anabrus simplex]|uniref:kinetochore-associated protein 1 n=1 Tax=Anabrus simplex TaxID=316456 RepID=UPI0035A3519B
MASWDRIKVGFEAEDETVNFGTRNILHNAGYLYETSTFAVIEPQGKVEENPHVQVAVLTSESSPILCVAINRTVVLFSDENCTSQLVNLLLGSIIKCFAITQDGSFLIIATSKNDLSCVEINSGSIIYNRSFLADKKTGSSIVQLLVQPRIKDDDAYCVLAVCDSGQIWRISWMLPNPATDGADVQCCCVRTCSTNKISSATLFTSMDSSVVVMTGRQLILWSDGIMDECINFEDEFPALVKVQEFQNSWLVCLTEGGKLALVCPNTLAICSVADDLLVQDFTVRTNYEESSILLLTQPNAQGEVYIHYATLPDFGTRYRVKVSATSYLVPGSSEFIFLEGRSCDDGSECIDALSFKILSQSQPLDRLLHLLRCRRFEEAETFAQQFNLDLDLVYKARSKHFVEMLYSHSNEDSFRELILLLDKIQDIKFVSEVCLKAVTADLADMKELLKYGFSRLTLEQKQGMKDGVETGPLLSQLTSMLFHLETFEIINELDSSVMEWLDFSSADLWQVCVNFLKQGKMSRAALIWTRHFSNLKSQLNIDKVLLMLNAIPMNVGMSSLLQWLNYFVPVVVSTYPQALEHLMNWAWKKVRWLEVSESQWPDTAIYFVEDILKLVSRNYHTGLGNLYRCSSSNVVIQHLTFLQNSLRDLQKLKTAYHIHITLEDYLQDDKYQVVHCILSKLYHHDIHAVLNGFVKHYILKHNLDWDKMIILHIELIIKSMSSLYGDQISDVGEQAAAILIGNIHNVSARIHCILEVLKAAPVPWSNTVTLLAEQGLQLNHPLVAEIRTQQHLIAAKIVFKKYNFDLRYLNSSSFKILLLLIRKIIKQGEKDMLKEALLIADKSVHLREEAYMLCIDSYIEGDEEMKALEIVHSLEPDLFEKCCERIKCRILAEGQSDVGYKYMNLLCSTSINFSKTKVDIDDVPLKEVKNIYRLKSDFETRITLSKYSCKNHCLKIVRTYIGNLIAQLPAKPSEEDIKNICTKARRIAQLFQFSPDDGLIEAYQQVLESNSLPLVSSAVAYILGKYGGSSVYREKLLDLVKQQLLADPKSHFIHAATHLAMKATVVCSTGQLHDWLNLVQHTEFLLSALPESGGIDKDLVKKWTFTPLYRDSSVLTKSKLLVQFIQDRLLSSQYPQEGIENTQLEVSKNLAQLSKDLLKEHLDVLLLKLIITIAMQGLLNEKQIHTIEINNLTVQVVKSLIRKVISFRQFDVEFGLCLICTLDSNLALQCLSDILQTYKQDYQKLSLIAKLGMLYTAETKLVVENQQFREIYVKCLWAKRLAKLGFPYKQAYVDSHKVILSVLQKLMQNPKVDITLIQEFCADFSLDLQEYLILYLEVIILSWEPQLETKVNTEGTTEIVVKNDEASVIKRCMDIINRMEDKSGLVKCLHSLWQQINFYYYEMYICIEMLQEMIPSKEAPSHYRFLLLFLKKYKRLRPPQREEIQKWLNHFPDTFSLPKISEWRLPFLPLIDGEPWKVIMPELKLNTYKQWLSAASILNLDTNALCSIVVRETVADMSLKKSESVLDEWCLHAEHAILLSEVERCISHITDMEKASAAYYCIMTHIPPGVDKLKAAKLCYAHTEKWAAESDSPCSRECLEKVRMTYLHFATKHILYSYNLGQPQYIKLSTQPLQLITELYKDPTIVERVQGCASQCPDINGATKEIAALHNIDLVKLCRELANDWLMPVSPFHKDMSDESTTNLTSTLQKCQMLIEEDENNMLRLCYLLKWEEMSSLTVYLIHCIFVKDSECSIPFKLKALRCLLSIMSEEQLELDTKFDTVAIRQHLQNLQYTCELEALGFIYSVEEFEACNKLSLVNSVLAREAFNPGALLFVCRLCLAYEIQDIQVWEPLLRHMMRLSMVKELEEVLLQFCEQSTAHVKAWDYILLRPFIRAELPLSEEQTEACMHSLVMLQSCPLTSSVKLKDLSKHCMRINAPHMAAVLLPYLDRKERTRLKQEIELLCDSKILGEKVKKLQHQGILIVPKILQVLQEPAHCL